MSVEPYTSAEGTQEIYWQSSVPLYKKQAIQYGEFG